MIDVSSVFDEFERVVAGRGFRREHEQYTPEAFGSRSRLFRRNAREALALTWDGCDAWLIVQGGIPWRDLVIYRSSREDTTSAVEVLVTLLGELSRAPDFDPAI